MSKFKIIVCLSFLFLSTFGLANPIDLTKYLPKGYDTTGKTDYTSYLQKGLDSNDNVLMPNFPILVNKNGLKLSSNQTINFQSKSKLIMMPNAETNYGILHIVKVKNVKVINPTLVGDRDKHTGTKGEWGMGIRVQGSNNVKIIGANISDFWGDGIYITRDGGVNSKNILIDQAVIQRNRRNGISVISGDNIVIQNSSFINNTGTNPMAAIDIEPNTPKDSLGYIKIHNIKTTQNRVGVQVSMMNFPSEKKQIFQLDIENVNSYKDQHGLLVRDFYRISKYGKKAIPLNGIVNYKNIIIKESLEEPIKYFNSKEGYEYGPKYHFSNIKIERNKDSQKWRSNSQIKSALKQRGFNIDKF